MNSDGSIWARETKFGTAEFVRVASWGATMMRCTLCLREASEEWFKEHRQKVHYHCLACNRWFTDRNKHCRYAHKGEKLIGQPWIISMSHEEADWMRIGVTELRMLLAENGLLSKLTPASAKFLNLDNCLPPADHD